MQAKTGPRLYSGPMQGGPKGQRAGDIRGAGSWMVHLIALLVCKGNGQGTWIPEQWPMAWRDGQRPACREKAWTLSAEQVWGRSRWTGTQCEGLGSSGETYRQRPPLTKASQPPHRPRQG